MFTSLDLGITWMEDELTGVEEIIDLISLLHVKN